LSEGLTPYREARAGIDHDRREDAALVLSDINDNEARTILSGLVRDNKASVAQIARRAEKPRP
jgi:hypothetical protein